MKFDQYLHMCIPWQPDPLHQVYRHIPPAPDHYNKSPTHSSHIRYPLHAWNIKVYIHEYTRIYTYIINVYINIHEYIKPGSLVFTLIYMNMHEYIKPGSLMFTIMYVNM